MKRLIPLLILLAAVAACGEDDTPMLAPTTSAPYSQTDLVIGTGAVAVVGNQVVVAYTGWLHDSSKPDAKGSQFETNPSFSLPARRGTGDSRLGPGCCGHAGWRPAPPGHSSGSRIWQHQSWPWNPGQCHAGLRHHAEQRSIILFYCGCRSLTARAAPPRRYGSPTAPARASNAASCSGGRNDATPETLSMTLS